MSQLTDLIDRIDAGKPPNKRWTVLYLAATVGGFFLSTYASSIANRLAPEKSLDIETDFEVGPPLVPRPWPYNRFDQCDELCTVDCGHCKGAGRPAAPVDVDPEPVDEPQAE